MIALSETTAKRLERVLGSAEFAKLRSGTDRGRNIYRLGKLILNKITNTKK